MILEWNTTNFFMRFSHLQALTGVSKRTVGTLSRWHLMTSDTSQAKSVVLIQWALVTGSGSISRSVCLCLNHFFFNHQHLAGFPQALYLCLSSLFHIYQWIRHRKDRQQLSVSLYEQRGPGGNVIIGVSSINTDVLSSSHERVRDRSLASGHEHLVFTVRRCGPTTLGAIKSSQPMAVKTKWISVAHANGHLWKH